MRTTRCITVALASGALLLSPACGVDDDDEPGITEEDVEEEVEDLGDDAEDLGDELEEEGDQQEDE